MEIINSLEIPMSLDEAWQLLLDIPRIAPCLPGAELTDVQSDSTYKGKVAVRLGPVVLNFVGLAKFEEIDPVAKQATVVARGTDNKGRGGASATVRFWFEPMGSGTKINVKSDVNLTGSIAQYGRGQGVIQAVATELVNQFSKNLRDTLARVPGQPIAANNSASQGTGKQGQVALVDRQTADQTAKAKPIAGFGFMLRVFLQYLKSVFYGGAH